MLIGVRRPASPANSTCITQPLHTEDLKRGEREACWKSVMEVVDRWVQAVMGRWVISWRRLAKDCYHKRGLWDQNGSCGGVLPLCSLVSASESIHHGNAEKRKTALCRQMGARVCLENASASTACSPERVSSVCLYRYFFIYIH